VRGISDRDVDVIAAESCSFNGFGGEGVALSRGPQIPDIGADRGCRSIVPPQ
jgi:hypothetical protein